jgi:oligopeptidase B
LKIILHPTNKDKAINFKLMKTLESKTSMDNWEDALAHREDVLLEDIDLFRDFGRVRA